MFKRRSFSKGNTTKHFYLNGRLIDLNMIEYSIRTAGANCHKKLAGLAKLSIVAEDLFFNEYQHDIKLVEKWLKDVEDQR